MLDFLSALREVDRAVSYGVLLGIAQPIHGVQVLKG
jgi:hypothetical protein